MSDHEAKPVEGPVLRYPIWKKIIGTYGCGGGMVLFLVGYLLQRSAAFADCNSHDNGIAPKPAPARSSISRRVTSRNVEMIVGARFIQLSRKIDSGTYFTFSFLKNTTASRTMIRMRSRKQNHFSTARRTQRHVNAQREAEQSKLESKSGHIRSLQQITNQKQNHPTTTAKSANHLFPDWVT